MTPAKTTSTPVKRANAATKPTGRKPMPHAEQKAIADELIGMLSKYAPPFAVRRDAQGGYHLWSEKDVVIDGRRRNELFFAGMIPQKDYVGLYYMPVYAEPEVKALFAPELLRLLKGKSCFHLKSLDKPLAKQIRTALADGFKMYKQRGWV